MQKQESIHPNPKGFDRNMWKTWQMWHSKTGHLPQFSIENQHVAPVLQMWQKKKKNKGFVF